MRARTGSLLATLIVVGLVAAAPGAGGASAPNPNCGNPGIGYGPWLGPVGGRGHDRMFARFALLEQNRTCKHLANAVVNCPNSDPNGPAVLLGTGSVRVPRKARKFTIKHSGRFKIRGHIYHGTPILVKARFVGKPQYSHGRFLGPRALKVKLTADKCADPGPFRFTVHRRGAQR